MLDLIKTEKKQRWSKEKTTEDGRMYLIFFLAVVISLANAQSSSPTYLGCFVDKSERDLNASSTESANNTVESCAAFCSKYKFFGVQYS